MAFFSMSNPMNASSALRGQGTAIRKNAAGKKKCRSQGRPPSAWTRINESATALKAPNIPGMRHSGFASKNGWMPVRKSSGGRARRAFGRRLSGAAGSGRSAQRCRNKNTHRMGTMKP